MLNFLGIGAQKAGTTWLYENLARHPHIHFPAGKEVHFWDKGDLTSIEAYTSRFPDHLLPTHKSGEITPAYALLPRERIETIYRLFPNLRIIYSVRDPIDRAWSSALMALKRAEMTVDEASDQWFIDHFHSQGSLARGDYAKCLDNWSSVYPKEQILVLDFEDIKKNPIALLRECSTHIGVDPVFYNQSFRAELDRKIYAGTGEPIRESLLPVLHALYYEKQAHYRALIATEKDEHWKRQSLFARAAKQLRHMVGAA
ncbi:MAG: sulfotransferase [Rickettsiales bacterium]|jgi:hypothetical protein|nr:sulfotransferase [Rickettsiales bacterium]